MTDKDNITLPREVVEKALRRAFYLGQNYWRDADSDSRAAHKRADKHLQDFDALCSDVLARTALAAEQPKPEPVAWRPRLSPNLCFHWSRPWSPGVPSEQTVDYWNQKGAGVEYAYAAPPATHPGYIIGSHWLETAYSRICAGEAEADVLRDSGWERVDDAEALRRDAEKWRKARAKYIAWQKGGKAEAMEGKT